MAVAVDFAQRTRAIYVNGEAVGTTVENWLHQVPGVWTPAAVYSVGHPDFIGARFVNTMSYYNGELDEVQVWKVALTQEQVQSAMFLGPPANAANLIAYYQFDEASGEVAIDNSPVGANASLGGGISSAVPARIASDARMLRPLAITPASPTSLTVELAGLDPDGDPVYAVITSLPAHGLLYQTADGVTPGALIDRVPAVATDLQGRVLLRRQAGYTGPDSFLYRITDKYLESAPRTVSLQLVTPPEFDSDGDGLPDVYESRYGLDAELADAEADFDGDGLTNGRERELGTRPDLDDTDGDLLRDGAEVAAGTDFFNRDTDNDGLIDGSDPQPTQVLAGLVFNATNEVTVTMGESLTVPFEVSCSNAPIAYLGFNGEPPAFVTLRPPTLSNAATSGGVSGVLGLNPIFDAAGEYSVRLTAAAQNGVGGFWDLHITVVPEAQFRTNRWRGAVGGAWSNAVNWTFGVPEPYDWAVIDAEGTNAYTIILDVDTDCRGIVLNSTNATLENWPGFQFSERTRTIMGALEVRRGSVNVLAPGIICHHPVLVSGAGRVSNGFLPGNTTNVWLDTAGTVTMGRSSLWIHGRRGSQVSYSNPDGARITTAGAIAVGDWWPLSRTLTILDGGALSGFLTHPIEIAGSVTASGYFGYTAAAPLIGAGTVHFVGTTYLGTTIETPVVMRRGAFVAMNYENCGQDCRESATFRARVDIEPGATFVINPPRTDRGFGLAPGVVLNNRGTIELRGILSGAADSHFENYGLILGDVAFLSVPTRIHPGGEIRVKAGTVMAWAYPMEVAGRLVLEPGAVIWQRSENSPLLAQEGAEFIGNGWLGLPDRGVQLTVNADATIPSTIALSSASVNGSGKLTLNGSQQVQGDYYAKTLLASGAMGLLSGSPIFHAPFEIAPGASLVRGSANSIYLDSGGVISNRGTITLPVNSATFLINGSVSDPGRIENAGLLETTLPVGQPSGQPVLVTFARVRVAPEGKLRVGSETILSLSGSGLLDTAGLVEVKPNAELRIGGAWNGQGKFGSLIAREGAEFNGEGTLAVIPGAEITFDMQGEAVFRLPIRFNGIANPHTFVTGPGLMRLEGQQVLDLERIDAALVIASAAVVTVTPKPTWLPPFQVTGPLTIESGGEFRLLGNTAPDPAVPVGFPQLVLHNVLRNFGRIVLGSGYNGDHPRLTGSGRVESVGLIQVVREASGPGRALVTVPTQITPGGRLQIDSDARLVFSGAGAGLSLAGQLNLAPGASLEHGLGTRLTLRTGNAVFGDGQLSFTGGGLRLEADTTIRSPLIVSSGFVADGPGHLIFVTDQSLGGLFQVPLVVRSGARVSAQPGTTVNQEMQIEPGGILELGAGQPTLNLNGRLRNEGMVRLASRTGAEQDRIRGDGWVDNEGLIEVTALSSNASGRALVRVPIHIGSSGVLALGSNALLGSPNGGVTNAGVLQVESSAVFTLDGDSSLVLQPDNELPGSGRVQFAGNAGLSVLADSTAQWRLEFNSNSLASGPATLTLANTQFLTGTFACPLMIASEAMVALANATFASNVLVAANGWLHIPGGQRLRLDSVLTNHGVLTLVSGDAASTLMTAGAGCVVNPGLFHVEAAGVGTVAAQICVPLIVTPTGQLTLGPDALVSFCDTAFLSVSGNVDTGPDSLLRFVDGPGRNLLALYAGATFTGAGLVQMEGDNHLLVLGRSTVAGGSLALLDQSTAAGMGRLLVGVDGQLSVDHSLTVQGVLEVRGRLNVLGVPTTLRVGTSLLLAGSGTLFNEGVVLVGGFVNEGGTIVGTPPTLMAPMPVTLPWITLRNLRMTANLDGPQMQFNWTALPGGRFETQVSTNLMSWSTAPTTVRETAPGFFEARIAAQPGPVRFFRVRQSATGGLE